MMIIQIAGRLGRDAETRFTPSGQKVTTLTLATNVRKGGKEETVWWRVTIWGERFDKMMPYLKKGSALIVVGEMGKPEIWTDKEGRPQVSLEITAEIIRFNPFGNPERSQEQAAGGAAQGQSQSTANHGGSNDFGSGYTGSNASQGGMANRHSQEMPAEDPLPF